MNHAPTLGEVVRSFKAASTRLIRKAGHLDFAWQRNYYEHVIRNEGELDRIRLYIQANPLNWAKDEDNPLIAGSRNPFGPA
jgi:putative transposase